MKNQSETKVAQDQSHFKELAEADMDALIAQFGALRVAACEVRTGIANGDEGAVREALAELDNHVDGYWHRIVMSYGTGQVHEYLESLKWSDSDE